MSITRTKETIRKIIGKIIVNNIDAIEDQFRERKQSKHL